MIFDSWWDGLILNAIVLVLAVLLDRQLPDLPTRFHPVVWIGHTVNFLNRFAPKKPMTAFLYGCIVALSTVGLWGSIAYFLALLLESIGPIAYVVGGAIVLRATFTVRGLSTAALETHKCLSEGRLEDARYSLRSLVSRDASSLSGSLVAAAAIESVAENTTDSFVAPWLAFAILGLPGAVAYRVINTLDSMIGHRGKYEYLGKASARLDDIVNFIPARLSAVLLLAGGAICRLRVKLGWRTMMRDKNLTASPNAGWTMSALAGLLGTRLEKVGHYRLGEEMPEPQINHIPTAVRVAKWVAALAIVGALGLLSVRYIIFALI